jgi:hypothetical protein
VNRHSGVFRQREHKYERGQALIFATMAIPLVFGLTGLVFDFAFIYIDQSVLNASTQAATLAGAQAMSLPGATPTSTSAAVTAFSGLKGDGNASSLLKNVSMTSSSPTLSCLTTLQTIMNISCYGPSSSNAISVTQQATVPTYFLRMFGAGSVTITSTATAAMKGASTSPYNVVIIVDTTRSMTDTDSDSNCNNTRISCALAGISVLLKHLSPCPATLLSCGTITGGNVANSVDRVSLMAFPPVTKTTVAYDYNCGGTVTTAAYATPFPATSTYQIVNFSSDYRTSDTANSLYTSSNIVGAVAKTGTPCMQAIGGFGTYYAQVIYAAQAYLVAEQSLYPTSQNVMILLSDGDSTANAADMPGASLISGVYPSTLQQCHQAITAAHAAATAGTRVYSVAYGSGATGCASDILPTITPCQTMQAIASAPGYFFSDYTATGGSSACISDSQPVTNLSQIFQVVAADLTVAKLIPNGTK